MELLIRRASDEFIICWDPAGDSDATVHYPDSLDARNHHWVTREPILYTVVTIAGSDQA